MNSGAKQALRRSNYLVPLSTQLGSVSKMRYNDFHKIIGNDRTKISKPLAMADILSESSTSMKLLYFF